MSGGHILTATMCETREQARFRTVGDLQRTAACMMRSMTGRKARVREGTADQPDLFDEQGLGGMVNGHRPAAAAITPG